MQIPFVKRRVRSGDLLSTQADLNNNNAMCKAAGVGVVFNHSV